MSEQQFYESEAILASLTSALRRRNSDVEASDLLLCLSQDQADALNDLLVCLVETLPTEAVSITNDVLPPGKVSSYGMRFHRSTSSRGQPVRMRFFRVQESAPTLAINTLGLAISIALLSPAAVVPAANIAKAIWDNIVSLEEDHDRMAMRVYDAILNYSVSNRNDSSNGPTSTDISNISELVGGERIEVADVAAALRRLNDLKIVSVGKWGGIGGELDHVENRWRILV